MADVAAWALSTVITPTKHRLTNVLARYRWVVSPLLISVAVRLFIFLSATFYLRLGHLMQFTDFLGPWLTKDTVWYLAIASRGYNYSPIAPSSVNFFPLYPLTIRLVQPFTGFLPDYQSYLLAGILVSFVTFCIACVLLYRLVLDRFDHATALGAVLLLAAFPFGVFYGAIYAESLYLLLALIAFLGIERRSWWLAGVGALFAGAERPPGLIVAACVVLAYAQDWLRTRHRLRWDVFALALTPLGAVAYVFYCWISFGAPFAYSNAARIGWGGGYLQSRAIHRALNALKHPEVTTRHFDIVYVVLFGLFLLSLVPIQRYLGLPYTLYAFVSLISPITTLPNINSLGRYMSVVFPTFIVLAYGLRRWPMFRMALVVLSTFFLWFFTVVFLTGWLS